MKKDISVEELKMIQLKILDSIDDFCKKNGMQYFLFSGTLIGAVRHKGYIPWDDDVDICMKRKDYDRFFAEFNQQRQDTLKAISTETEKDYYLASGKVIDTATVIEEENNYAMPIGVYVDVFPMDYLPADDKKLKQLNHRIDIYRKMLVLKSVPVSDRRSTVKNWVLKVSSFLLKPISMQHLISKIAKLATSYGLYDIVERYKNDDDVVLIHDAIRPMVSADVITDNIRVCRQYKFALGIAYSKHLLRVKVLNIVDVLGVLHPLTPNTQQTSKNRRLRNGEHIIHFSNLESCPHCPKEIGNNILHTALFIGLTELRHSNSQNLHAIDFFFVIFLCLIFILNRP